MYCESACERVSAGERERERERERARATESESHIIKSIVFVDLDLAESLI